MAKGIGHQGIVLKGTKGGLTVKIHPDLDYEEVKSYLVDKFASYDRFLSGADVFLDWGDRELTTECFDELKKLFAAVNLKLKGFVKTSPSSMNFQEGNLMKNKKTEELDGLRFSERSAQPDSERAKNKARNSVSPPKVADDVGAVETASTAASTVLGGKGRDPVGYPEVSEHTVLIQRTIRSGQTIQYPGNIVVLGDVNPGAELVAGGNIIVMGNLRGIAHAGATGDENAIVTAFRLQPSQLRIADHFTRAPDNESGPPDQPEVARIKDDTVIIEKYQFSTERQPRR